VLNALNNVTAVDHAEAAWNMLSPASSASRAALFGRIHVPSTKKGQALAASPASAARMAGSTKFHGDWDSGASL
jgi:hypothetical protein